MKLKLIGLLMIAGQLCPAVSLAAETTQLAFTCRLAHPDGQLYKTVNFEGLVDTQSGQVQYAMSESDHDGKELVSEKGISLYSNGQSQISIKIKKNAASVNLPADILSSVKPIVANYKKVESVEALNCRRSSIALGKNAEPELYDQLKFPNENQSEIGKPEVFHRKNWLSSDGSMAISADYVPKSGPDCHYNCGPAFSTLKISFFGPVTGNFGANETNINYLFYNPNALPELSRTAQAKLVNAEDVRDVQSIFSQISQNGMMILDIEGVHSSKVKLTIDCSSQMECAIKAKN